MIKPYSRTEWGPPLEEPFTVLTGFVVISTASNATLLVTAGGCWPGVDNLSAELLAHLQPVAASVTPGTKTSPHVSPAAIEGGLACLLVQALTSFGELSFRLELGRRYLLLDEISRTTVAGVLGVSRESLSYAIKKGRS